MRARASLPLVPTVRLHVVLSAIPSARMAIMGALRASGDRGSGADDGVAGVVGVRGGRGVVGGASVVDGGEAPSVEASTTWARGETVDGGTA